MKVAIVVHDLSKKRGHDRYAVELIEYLLRNGTSTSVFANRVECEFKGLLIRRVPVLKKPIFFKILSFFLLSSFMIDKKGYDIVHSQGLSTLRCNIITIHICHAGYLRVVKKYYKEGSILKRIYYNLMCYILSLMEKFVFGLPWVKRIIAPSEKVKNELMRYYRIDEKKIKVIYHGVNLEEFNPENIQKYRRSMRNNLGINEDAKVILFVGEFWRKGLDIVMKAISEIENTILLVVGPGNTHPYKLVAHKLNIISKVIFTGETDEVNKYYAAADIFVCPSHYESFGLVVTEAMATGIPVIISKEMGVKELIKNNENGIILNDYTSPEEIRKNIINLIDDKEFYDKLSRNGYLTVKNLSWEKVAERVCKEYLEILN